MLYAIEALIATLVISYFIKREHPKMLFLLWGFLFFFLSLLLQLPFRIAEFYVTDLLPSSLIPALVSGILTVIISETTKFFSLKRFMKTKSYKNGILFGLGWISLESITAVSALFYSSIFTWLGISFNPYHLLPGSYGLFTFVYLFLINAAVTVYVIIGVIKKRYAYLGVAILYAATVYLGLQFLNGFEEAAFVVLSLLYALYVIFKYRTLK